MGSTCDTVASKVEGPTRSPICAVAMPATPSRSDRTFVKLDVQARGLDRGLRGLHRGVCRELRLDVVVQLTLRDGALLGERRVALDVALSPTELRARFCELRLGLCQRDGERARIDFKEHFVLADHRALAVVPLHQVTRHLRPDLAVGVAVERRNPLAGDLDRLGHDLDHRDRRRWWPRPMRARLRSLCSPRPGG